MQKQFVEQLIKNALNHEKLDFKLNLLWRPAFWKLGLQRMEIQPQEQKMF